MTGINGSKDNVTNMSNHMFFFWKSILFVAKGPAYWFQMKALTFRTRCRTDGRFRQVTSGPTCQIMRRLRESTVTQKTATGTLTNTVLLPNVLRGNFRNNRYFFLTTIVEAILTNNIQRVTVFHLGCNKSVHQSFKI